MDGTVLLVMDLQRGVVERFGDADPEVHRVLTQKVFPRQAEVTTVAEWTAQRAAELPRQVTPRAGG